VAQEMARCERLFSDFIVQAAKLYADALTHQLEDISALVSLYSMKAQLSLFASGKTTAEADAVLRTIIAEYYWPNKDFHIADEVQSGNLDIRQALNRASRPELTG
jgi:hypothetical protein